MEPSAGDWRERLSEQLTLAAQARRRQQRRHRGFADLRVVMRQEATQETRRDDTAKRIAMAHVAVPPSKFFSLGLEDAPGVFPIANGLGNGRFAPD
jgi:hypothetical protein